MKKRLEDMTKFLSAESKIGLTVGQLFSVIGVLIMIMVMWGNFQVKISSIELKQIELEARINNTENVIEVIRKENREEHQDLGKKVDQVILLLSNK